MMRPEDTRRRTGRIVKTIMKVLIFLPIFIFVMGEVVLRLWNWLMPVLFHLPAVTFWQALGLLVLSWTLFGGLRGMGPRHRGFGRGGFRERLENMTPEEREKMREKMREWVHNRVSPTGGAAADAQPKA
jgi:hypothetical protein